MSASTIVLSRCAMAIVVRPAIRTLSAAWISASISLSTALVASSRIRSGAFGRDRPGEREQLPLADADRGASLTQHLTISLREAAG